MDSVSCSDQSHRISHSQSHADSLAAVGRSQQDGKYSLYFILSLKGSAGVDLILHSFRCRKYLTTDMFANHYRPESWIEVSSRPSSSSLSSAADEIITTGLRVQDMRSRRRRRSLRPIAALQRHQQTHAGTSSQEEYEESESESDRVMTSSNEGLPASALRDEWQVGNSLESGESSGNADASDEDYEDDENATAVGVAASTFTPQPNAFSHRPSISSHQHSSIQGYGTSSPSRPPHNSRHSYPLQQTHSPYNAISPSHYVDHDAALRASLSTLLSCAAAARKSKVSTTETQLRPPGAHRIDTTTISIVPETVALGEAATNTRDPESEKGKRKVLATNSQGTSQSRSNSKDRRATKKPRRTMVAQNTYAQEVSPTLLTWVVGAGMLVLVSAISFSAGYVVGRETGHAEAAGFGEVGVEVKRNLTSKGSGLGLRKWTGAAVGVCV
jgi:hypothetical protein